VQADGEDRYLCGCVADDMAADAGMDAAFGQTTAGDAGIVGD
jgi:hypothetical protein